MDDSNVDWYYFFRFSPYTDIYSICGSISKFIGNTQSKAKNQTKKDQDPISLHKNRKNNVCKLENCEIA